MERRDSVARGRCGAMLGWFAHDERQRNQTGDKDGEAEERILIAEHCGLTVELLVGVTDGGLRGLGGGHAFGDEGL